MSKHKRNPGVYTIRCSVSPNFYVGSSMYLEERWKAHKSNLQKNKHHCRHLQMSEAAKNRWANQRT